MYKAKLTKSTGDSFVDKRIIELTEQAFNTDNDGPPECYLTTTTLDGCFVWEDTDEGHDYWEFLAFTKELEVIITRVATEVK